MKKLLALLSFILLLNFNSVHAKEVFEQDTLYTQLRNDLVVLSSTKETNSLKSLPAAVSVLSPRNLESLQIHSMKDLSSYVPNFFIPNYGSKMTAPLYIRGIGARTGTQTVSMYVDNIPYFNTTAFDTELYDIQRIEVLRGTQGTLYGRNAMGGIINIYTLSPLTHQGTTASVSGGNHGYFSSTLSHYQNLNDNMGFSVSGYYKRDNGFFTNEYTGKKADESQTAGGKVKFSWKPSANLLIQLSSHFDYTDQGAFPYMKLGENKVNFNSPSNYNRKLLTNGVTIQHTAEKYIFTSTTGYQYLNDDMNMDQDYTPKSIFTINQKQNQHSLSQEFTFKSNSKSKYQWSNGVFGFYDHQKVTPPVHMLEKGIEDLLQKPMDQLAEANPRMPKIKFLDDELVMGGIYKRPTYGAAIFHQSTFNDILETEGLSFTAGLRLDYEKTELDYDASTQAKLKITVAGRDMFHTAAPLIKGKASKEYLELLPKFVLKYQVNPNSHLYFSASKGYKTGGHNVQIFADLLNDALKESIMNYKPGQESAPTNVNDKIEYDPEYSWNYEFGGQLDLIENTLALNFALFYIDVKDVQITRFVQSGSGRETANAGKAVSKGFELGLKARPCTGFYLYANYGFSDARFKDDVNMNKHITFAPQSTLSLGANITYETKNCPVIDRIIFDPNFTGVGSIHWTDDNSISQGFYAVTNARVALEKDIFGVEFWGKNIFDRDYQAFYFESMRTPYVQMGRPAQWGVTLRVKL